MKRLKRSECAVLHLGLKHYWYRMIEDGTKHVEFREAKPYWNTRIENWIMRMRWPYYKKPVLEFQSGYGRFSPRMWFIAGRPGGIMPYLYRGEKVPVQHKELGEFPKARYCLLIGEQVIMED